MDKQLSGKCVLLGVTGGIACYKAANLCSMLVKAGCDVRVVMTKNAMKFISPLVFSSLSGNPVATDTFERECPHEIDHIALSDRANLCVIAPATANIIAKCKNGIADDMLTTTILASDCPKIIVPAMNTRMYENPVTKDNIRALQGYGWEVIEPVSGRLACGTTGRGKMPEPEVIFENIVRVLSLEKDMIGINVTVTAGPTLEAIDPVRYLTNHSTGRMGYAIARAAVERGAKVTLISGPTNLTPPAYVDLIPVVSAADMFEAVKERHNTSDIIIKAAAVADYRPVSAADEKIKKAEDGSDLTLKLERTDDILMWLGKNRRDGQLLCGFSMESENVLENSRKKLLKKNVDMIAANSIRQAGAGFGVDTNVLTLISRDKEQELPLLSKDAAAHRLLDELLKIQKKQRSLA